jgi:hypothetical protein
MLSGKLVSRMSILNNYVRQLCGTYLGTGLLVVVAPFTNVARTALMRANTMENFMVWNRCGIGGNKQTDCSTNFFYIINR